MNLALSQIVFRNPRQGAIAQFGAKLSTIELSPKRLMKSTCHRVSDSYWLETDTSAARRFSPNHFMALYDLRLLPHDAETFFGLRDGYDRRDLKRSYGKSIRQFNPETHPSEFQLVREAYERLEQQLRYGSQQKAYAEAVDAWAPVNEDSEEGAPVARQSATRNSKRTMTIQQLALVDPARALRKLETKTVKSPQDYYLSAVLVDASGGRPTPRYLVHLVDGMVAFPDDPGLLNLTAEYIRTEVEVPGDGAVKLVQYIARRLRSPVFYMLTETIWVRLVATCDFEEVRTLLSTCEQQIHQTDLAAQTTFYLRLLRTAIWVAPKQWSRQILMKLESQSASVSEGDQQELEFLSDIMKIIRSNKAKRNAVRRQLLEAVRLICQTDEAAAVDKVTEILAKLGNDSAAFQEAFPVDHTDVEDSDDQLWCSMVHRLTSTLQEWMPAQQELPVERIEIQIAHLLNDLIDDLHSIKKADDRLGSYYSTLPGFLWLAMVFAFTLLPIQIITNAYAPWLTTLATLLAAIPAFLFGVKTFTRWIRPLLLEQPWQEARIDALFQVYHKKMRNRVFRFAQNSNENLYVHAARIDAVGTNMNLVTECETFIMFLGSDVGLAMFANLRTVAR